MTTYAVVYPDSKQAVAVRRTRAAALAVVEHRPAGAQLVIVETEEKPRVKREPALLST